MNALLRPEVTLGAMRIEDLESVMTVEHKAYKFPWTRGNFIDSLAAGYRAQTLVQAGDGLIGYSIAMAGVDEMHLLNLTVAPAHQRLGHARTLLDALEQACRKQRVPKLWLEVRASNERARQVYARRGFAEVGLRRGYYPAGVARREDAIVMSLTMNTVQGDGLD